MQESLGKKLENLGRAAVVGLTLLSAVPEQARAGEPLTTQELQKLRSNTHIDPSAESIIKRWRMSVMNEQGAVTVGGGLGILRYEQGAIAVRVSIAEGENPKSAEDDGLTLVVSNSDGSLDIATLTDTDPDESGVKLDTKLSHIEALPLQQ